MKLQDEIGRSYEVDISEVTTTEGDVGVYYEPLLSYKLPGEKWEYVYGPAIDGLLEIVQELSERVKALEALLNTQGVEGQAPTMPKDPV